MLKKNPLLKYLMPDKPKSEIFHSSTYARAQSQSNFGSASNQSFSARQALDQQRTTIQNYKFSKVAAGISRNSYQSSTTADKSNASPETRSPNATTSRFSSSASRQPSSRSAAPSARPSFSRPPFSRPK